MQFKACRAAGTASTPSKLLAIVESLRPTARPPTCSALSNRSSSSCSTITASSSFRPFPAGAKKREDINRAFNSIYPVLQNFKKGDASAVITTTKRKRAQQSQQAGAKRQKGGKKQPQQQQQ